MPPAEDTTSASPQDVNEEQRAQPWKALLQQVGKGNDREDLIVVRNEEDEKCSKCGKDSSQCSCTGVFLAA